MLKKREIFYLEAMKLQGEYSFNDAFYVVGPKPCINHKDPGINLDKHQALDGVRLVRKPEIGGPSERRAVKFVWVRNQRYVHVVQLPKRAHELIQLAVLPLAGWPS